MTYMLLSYLLLVSSFSSTQTKEVTIDTTLNSGKVLIVYLSRTNNTKAIAEIIHKNVGGTIAALD